MYVDVIASRRGRKKVDVTLAKRSTRGPSPTVVSIPVKKAALPADEEFIEIIDVVDELEEELGDIFRATGAESLAQEYAQQPQPAQDDPDADAMLELLALTGSGEDDTPLSELEFFSSDSTPDEDMTAIDRMLAGADGEETLPGAEEQFDSAVSGALDELDGMSRRADGMRERLDDQLAEALEAINGSTEEESEELTETIGRELESLSAFLHSRDHGQSEAAEGAEAAEAAEEIWAAESAEDSVAARIEAAAAEINAEAARLEAAAAADDAEGDAEDDAEGDAEGDAGEGDAPHDGEHCAAEGNAYMRYFDRDTHGGRVEVSPEIATGQEVVCYDEASGKLSRVCGIIKKDGEAPDNI